MYDDHVFEIKIYFDQKFDTDMKSPISLEA